MDVALRGLRVHKGTDCEEVAREQLRLKRAGVRREQRKWETMKGAKNIRKKKAPATWLEVPVDDDGVEMQNTKQKRRS